MDEGFEFNTATAVCLNNGSGAGDGDRLVGGCSEVNIRSAIYNEIVVFQILTPVKLTLENCEVSIQRNS